MCGIAGFVGFADPAIGRIRLDSMRRALAHRGPDASGVFQDPAGGAGLAHTRLSILDPTARADQPFHHHDRWTLVFNGEIYNFQELRADLLSHGETFFTTSDTEVLMHLLIREGTRGLARLQGMYAFALWDRKERTLLLGRDAFGIKPLYLTSESHSLAFASEVRCLVGGGWVQPDLCPTGVASYFQRGSADTENPLISGVRALPPGSWLEWKNGTVRTGTLPPIPLDADPTPGNAQTFRSAFLDSVRLHLTSDVPVGLFLSGGIDSAAVLAGISASKVPAPLSLTLSFPGLALDESRDAAAMASHFGSPHHIRVLHPEADILPWFREHLALQDLPSIDGFNVFCISRVAREHGLKVVLSGLGGDELLGGYPSFRNIPRMIRTSIWLHRMPGAVRLARCFLKTQGSRGRRLAHYLDGPPTPFRALESYRSIFPPNDIPSCMQELGLSGGLDSLPSQSFGSGFIYTGHDLRVVVDHWEATTYMQRQLLRDADACSMAHGVELRVPFLHVPLWAAAAQLPLNQRFEPGKRLLSRALPELPLELFSRRKRGFTLPWDTWLQGPLSVEWQAVPRGARILCTTWYQRMAWISLTAWRRQLSVPSNTNP